MATPATTASNEYQADAHDTASTDEMYRLIISFARKGDWEKAKNIFEGHPNLKKQVTSTYWGRVILKRAAFGGEWKFFDEMLKLFPINSRTLTIHFNNGRTILHEVAYFRRSMKSVKALVEKCPSLTQMTDSEGRTPLHTAIGQSNSRDLIWYLALKTSNEMPGRPFTGPHAPHLLYLLISRCYYDITFFLLQRHPYLPQILLTAESDISAVISADPDPALRPLASRPCDFPSGAKFGWLTRCIYPFVPVDVGDCKPPNHIIRELGGCSSSGADHQLGMQISETSLRRRRFQCRVWGIMEKLVPPLQRIRERKFNQESVVRLVEIACQKTKWTLVNGDDPEYQVILKTLERAVVFGTIDILRIYMQYFPLPLRGEDQRKLMRGAIENRQDKILNLFLHKHPDMKVNIRTDAERWNSLHLVAKTGDCPKIRSIAGAAFQMQKEMQWFKGIEKLANPYAKQQLDKNNQTAWALFEKEHENMRKEGEKWMKNTSTSCMLAATLIATIVFAAAFTVPGGNYQDTGTPIFLHSNTFMLFAVSDYLALVSSINSLWMFLSILTARFVLGDFLETLPKRLIFGLASLFVAIVSTMIAFSAAVLLVLSHRQKEVIIFIVLTAFTSAAMFAILQLPLFIEMVRSTYFHKLLGS